MSGVGGRAILDVMPETRSEEWLWRQLVRLVVVVVGLLPVFFPQLTAVEEKGIVFVIALAILGVTLIGEIWRAGLEKQKKDIAPVLSLQVLAHVVFLTIFLHFFGRINGPLFVLYLPLVMEAFLYRNIFLAQVMVGTMILALTTEFFWLVLTGEVHFGFMPGVGYAVRVFSLLLMRAYGSVLSQKIISEEQTLTRSQRVAEKLTQATRELRKVNVKLKELSVLKDEFVSVASHELRAPLTIIKGFISMIIEGDAGKIPPKVKKFLGDVYESNERMIRLVNNMLNVSRIESGRLVVNLQNIQIETSIEGVVKNFRLEARKHGLELKYFKPKKKLPKVRVDPDRLKEVIANLVGNSLNFTPHGYVYIKSYEENEMVTVKVEDTGIGIAVEDQKELFKKFFQVSVGAPLKKGSGLGLYICKMLINEFGGDIWLKSEVGRGTTFYFSLPAINSSV